MLKCEHGPSRQRRGNPGTGGRRSKGSERENRGHLSEFVRSLSALPSSRKDSKGLYGRNGGVMGKWGEPGLKGN